MNTLRTLLVGIGQSAWANTVRDRLRIYFDPGDPIGVALAHRLADAGIVAACPRCGHPAHPDTQSCLIAEDRRSDAREAMADVVEQAAAMEGEDLL